MYGSYCENNKTIVLDLAEGISNKEIVLFFKRGMINMFRGKAVVAQGGGPTAVINQSLAGAVLELRKYPQVTGVYGAINGVKGIVKEDFYDLSYETEENLELVADTPSSALFTTRDKPDEKYCHEIFKVLKAHDIRYFFYIGGNDSADTVRIVSSEAQKSDYQFRAIHIPKTIDNDLLINDHTPGYPSSAKYVINAFKGINLDNRAQKGVHIGVVMGRDAGFLTASSGLARKYSDDGPHLIYLRERIFNRENFLKDVKEVYDRLGTCVIAISEGVKDEKGVPVAAGLIKNIEMDAHGNMTLSNSCALGELLTEDIKSRLNIKRVRSDTFGYIQRCFCGCVSEVDRIEAREVGRTAVHFAMDGINDGSVTIHRTGNYSVEYRLSPLEDVACKTKCMPDNFINSSGNYITDEFREYLTPLLGKEMKPTGRIMSPLVPKLLNK